MKKLIKAVLILVVLAYVGYGITCTIAHNKEAIKGMNPCGSCWALTDLLDKPQAGEQ